MLRAHAHERTRNSDDDTVSALIEVVGVKRAFITQAGRYCTKSRVQNSHTSRCLSIVTLTVQALHGQ